MRILTFAEWSREYNPDGLNAGAAWNAALDQAMRVCSDRFLGGGSHGGGISDLDDLDSETQSMCAEAIGKLKHK